MKNVLSAFALRVTLLFAAFAFVSAATSSAQSAVRRPRPVMLPVFIVMEERITPPELNLDGAYSQPESTLVTQPTRNADGSITLVDGTVLQAPVHHDDGTVSFHDGAEPSRSQQPAPASPARASRD